MLKSYNELIKLETFEARKEYLYIGNGIGVETFGNDRYLNQMLYHSKEWLRLRDEIIIRDNGCDLGIDGCDLRVVIVHHINPITPDDIINRNPKVFDPDNLISVSRDTHNYIHYGTNTKDDVFVERSPNDTCPWKK